VIFNSFLLTYAIKTTIFGNFPGPHPKIHFFSPTQKYFSWPAGENLKSNKNITENGATGEFFAQKNSKWAKKKSPIVPNFPFNLNFPDTD